MKRSPIVLLLLAALLPAVRDARAESAGAAPSALPEGTEPYGPEVLLAKEDSVPVRTDPGFVYREMRFLKKGQEVVVDGRKGQWLHVKPQGWVLADHVVTQEQFDKPEPPQSQAMVPVREGIRVRVSPSTDAQVTRTLHAGEEVQVTGQEGGWWKLDDGGYVASSLLRASGDEPEAASSDEVGPAPWVVAADTANVRADRNTTAAIVRKLNRGDIVPVTSVKEGWAEVGGGWVRTDLLQPPAPRPTAGRPTTPQRSRLDDAEGRHWSLVDLSGVIFEVTDISGTPILQQIRHEIAATGELEDDWTYLGLTIGVPEDSAYRFNYSPDRNFTIIEDEDGQKFGNVYVLGPLQKLPAQVRQFFMPMTVAQGEKFDGILLFKPSLKIQNIRDIQMMIGGRMQRLYESTSN